MEVLLSIGSNLGNRLKNIKSAIENLKEIGKVKKVSQFYITKPMYYETQPYFINCIVEIETKRNPFNLLEEVKKIEKIIGRKKRFRYGPREIDIDIVYYGNKTINSNNLKIPHPRLYERIFVLKPLYDIKPNFKDFKTGKSIKELLEKIQNNFILKIPNTYYEALVFLTLLKPRDKNDFNISYILDTLKVLGNPHLKMGKIIHITGSVAKTSTANYIAKILMKKGKRVALYTSPHIEDIRERIVYNDKIISKGEFLKNLVEVISYSYHIHSFFEYLTILSFNYFSKLKPDYSVIEVGMGGRDDATNVFKKSYSVFTTITLEHSKYLGKSLKEIAKNKSGIIKRNSTVFISTNNKKDVIQTIKKIAQKKKSKTFMIEVPKSKNYLRENFNVALMISELILKEKINMKYFKLKLKGRRQITTFKNQKILLDGAHTPISIIRLLNDINPKEYPIVLCSFMKDKKYNQCLSHIIKKDFNKIIITKSLSPRSFEPKKIKVSDKKIYIIENPLEAFRDAISYSNNIIILGSLYFVGDILSIIKGKKRIYFNELN